jgi:hypothetical protein
MNSSLAIGLCWVQGSYWLVTAVWPLISIKSFQAVTGPKTDHLVTGREADHWLVNTVGMLILADAIVFLSAAIRKQVSVDVATLAVLSAAALVAIDVVYSLRGTISRIYLADAVIEIILIALWGVASTTSWAALVQQT